MLDLESHLDIIHSQGNTPRDEEVSQVSVALLALILPSAHSLSHRSLYSLPPAVPAGGMGQAGEGGPGRGLRGHAEDSDHGEAPPGLVLSCRRYSLGALLGPPSSESLDPQVGRRGSGGRGIAFPKADVDSSLF